MESGDAQRSDGRVFKAHKIGARGLRHARVQLDVGARDQRAQPRDARAAQPGPDHPKARVDLQQFCRRLIEAKRGDDAFEVGGEPDRLHDANADAAALDGGFFLGDAFGGLKAHGDERALRCVVLPDEPCSEQRRHQRDDPYR